MTESARQALVGLRDFSTLQWYVVPLLALLFYVYLVEIRAARATGNWDPVIAGATVFCADFVNESINGWIFSISGYSALWLAPGPTALRTLVGWNVEIMFMFGIAGILYCKSIDEDPTASVFGLPNRWFWALFYSGGLGDRGAGAQQGRASGVGLPLVEPRRRRDIADLRVRLPVVLPGGEVRDRAEDTPRPRSWCR